MSEDVRKPIQDDVPFKEDIVRSSSSAIATCDLDGRMTYGNPAFLRAWGFDDPKGFLGRPFWEFWSVEGRLDEVMGELREKGVWADEIEAIRNDGIRFPVQVTAAMVYDSAGNPLALTSTSIDITERKQAERALLETRERSRKLFDIVPDMISIHDPEMNIVYSNWNGFARVPEEKRVLDTKCYATYRGYDSVCPDCEARRVLTSKAPFGVERELPDGTWVDIRVIPLLDEHGEVELFMEWVRDITSGKRWEQALQESEEKYRLLFEHANDAIFIAQNGMIRFPNPRTLEITGYSREGLESTPFVELLHPEDRERVLDIHYRRMSGEEGLPTTYAFRIINRAGEERTLELSSVVVSWQGNPATLNFVRDITQKKRMERQLQQAQKMESLGTLAGGIAHNFNNVLMGIQGRTSLMMADKGPSHPDHEHLAGIEEYIKNAVGLTKDLLGFARGGKYEVKPTELNALIQQENRMFGQTKREITIQEKYDDRLWAVEVDQGQIRQALLNLYVNAWQAMPGGGILSTQTENVFLNEEQVASFDLPPGRYVRVSVSDNGVGMDASTRKKIFEPFFTTQKMGRGTGLGLASVYGIVKNHGGWIQVDSEKGAGTTFNIYLPASDREVSEDKAPDQEVLTGEGTILLVDDEAMVLEVGGQLLNKLGYRVLTAASVEDALEVFTREMDRIDLVILDMIMPDMGGGEAFDRMKAKSPGVSVLLSSGYSLNGQAQEILDRGCSGFLQKPFDLKALSQKVAETLGKNRD